MRRSILLVLIAICFFAALLDLTFADGVSNKLVRSVAEVHLRVQNLKEQFFQDLPKAEYSIKDIKSLRNENGENVLAYIVNLNPKGYMVISPDTDIRPSPQILFLKIPQKMHYFIL
jgi:pentose-5-phosphate-3-epimerase